MDYDIQPHTHRVLMAPPGPKAAMDLITNGTTPLCLNSTSRPSINGDDVSGHEKFMAQLAIWLVMYTSKHRERPKHYLALNLTHTGVE